VNGRAAFAAVCGLALGLRALRAATRWGHWPWLLAAAPGEHARLWAEGRPLEAVGLWMGLHGPLWPNAFGALEAVAPVPALWLAASAALATAGVVALARVDRRAGLLLATAPVALHYAGELNDYPLVLGMTGLAWAARTPAGAAAAALGAAWTHPLAGVGAAVALLRFGRAAAPAGLVLVLGALPLVPGALALLTDTGTARQPSLDLARSAADAARRFGPAPLLAVPLALVGLRHAPVAALGLALPAALWAALVAARVAAPHQFAPWTVWSAPAALLVAAGLRSLGARAPRAAALTTLTLALLGAGPGLLRDLRALTRIHTDAPRGIDLALGALEVPDTCGPTLRPDCAGDALLLIGPAGPNDDDKTTVSPSFYRLGPLARLPRRFVDGEDPRAPAAAAPRRFRGHVVYVDHDLRPSIVTIASRHRRLVVVSMEPGRRPSFTTNLAAALGAPPQAVGPDLVFVVGAALPSHGETR
jgi:hypothetical protein